MPKRRGTNTPLSSSSTTTVLRIRSGRLGLVRQIETSLAPSLILTSTSDSQLKAWLVQQGIVKSDAQIKREKAEQLVAKNWYGAKDTAWSAWSELSMKSWLIDHGYMRTDAQVKRDELVKLMNEKYTDAYGKTADYLTWPDARLRAYLRSWNVDDTKIVGRPSLLQEVRIRYYQANNKIEDLLNAIRSTIYSGVENAEATLSQVRCKSTIFMV